MLAQKSVTSKELFSARQDKRVYKCSQQEEGSSQCEEGNDCTAKAAISFALCHSSFFMVANKIHGAQIELFIVRNGTFPCCGIMIKDHDSAMQKNKTERGKCCSTTIWKYIHKKTSVFNTF